MAGRGLAEVRHTQGQLATSSAAPGGMVAVAVVRRALARLRRPSRGALAVLGAAAVVEVLEVRLLQLAAQVALVAAVAAPEASAQPRRKGSAVRQAC